MPLSPSACRRLAQRIMEQERLARQLERDAAGRRITPGLQDCPHCGGLSPYLHDACGWCSACCLCMRCAHCTTVTGSASFCFSCQRCQSCCRCMMCPRCRHSTSATCPVCGRCHNCCTTTPGRSVHFVPREAPVFWGSRTKPDPLIRSKRFIAAEIEVSKADPANDQPIDAAVARWQCAVVHDGSLGGNGFEINTAPASGTHFSTQIHDLCSALALQNAVVTTACGCHIHVDARDFGIYEIKRLIYLYAAIEPALFAIVPPDRRASQYCLPCGPRFLKYLTPLKPQGWVWKQETRARTVTISRKTTIQVKQVFNRREGDAQRLRQAVSMAVYDRTFKDRTATATKQDKRGAQRYRALNLHSWFHRKTIEWRLPEGTVTADTILHWGALLSRIMDIVYQTPESEIKRYQVESEGASVALLKRLVPECSEWIARRYLQYRPPRQEAPPHARF